MSKNFTKIAFTQNVKMLQEKYGTRDAYARMEQAGDSYLLTGQEKSFIQARDSFYMATVGENNWPYVQHRGGPKGFLRVIDDSTFGYADFRGNGQYISAGNLVENKRASLILMDYPNRQRLKIWAEMEMLFVDEKPELLKHFMVPGYKAKIERLMIFHVQAFDWNCPQHITPKYTAEEAISLYAGDTND